MLAESFGCRTSSVHHRASSVQCWICGQLSTRIYAQPGCPTLVGQVEKHHCHAKVLKSPWWWAFHKVWQQWHRQSGSLCIRWRERELRERVAWNLLLNLHLLWRSNDESVLFVLAVVAYCTPNNCLCLSFFFSYFLSTGKKSALFFQFQSSPPPPPPPPTHTSIHVTPMHACKTSFFFPFGREQLSKQLLGPSELSFFKPRG